MPISDNRDVFLTRFGEKFSIWANRWVPNSLVLVFLLTIIVAVLALLLCKSPLFLDSADKISVVNAWGKGVWVLLTFSMQVCLVMITGDVLANAPIVKRLISKVACMSKSSNEALVTLGFVVFVTRWIHWGFGMMIGIVLGREILAQAKLKGIRVHKVALAAVCYCMSCATIGISNTGPLYVAGEGWLASYVPEAYKSLVPLAIPLTDTVLTPAVLSQCAILGILTVAVVYAMMPKSEQHIEEITDEFRDEILKSAAAVSKTSNGKALPPSQKLNNGRFLNLVIGGFGIIYCVQLLASKGVVGLSVNSLNLVMFTLGIFLHRSPNAYSKAVAASVGTVAGVIIQFPLYAGIYGIINYTGLTGAISDFFMLIATAKTFPAVTYIYSAILNFFVPSAGSKFIIEVPYIIPTAIDLGSSLSSVVNAYAFGGYSTNLIQPFWAIPILSMFRIEFKDIIPYGFVMCFVAGVVSVAYALFLY